MRDTTTLRVYCHPSPEDTDVFLRDHVSGIDGKRSTLVAIEIGDCDLLFANPLDARCWLNKLLTVLTLREVEHRQPPTTDEASPPT